MARAHSQTFDSYLDSAALTEAPLPRYGPPPPNLTHIVARAVVSQPAPKPTRTSPIQTRTSSLKSPLLGPESAEKPKWRHGMRSTRNQILSLVKERQHVEAVATTPRGDCTPRGGPGSAPLARANSMDFLPVSLPGPRVATAARLGAKLQRDTGVQEAAYTAPPVAGASNPMLRRPAFNAMARTNSLSSIAGSPSQPPRVAPKVALASSFSRPPQSAAAAAFAAFHMAPQPTSSQMSRVGSDCGPSVDPLERFNTPGGSFSASNLPKWSSEQAESSSAGLVMNDRPRRPLSFEAARQPAGAGLGLDAAFESGAGPGHRRTASASARKRLATGASVPAPMPLGKRRSVSPPRARTLFPDLVVTEHEDELPTRSLKSLSLHPTVQGGRQERTGAGAEENVFAAWGGFQASSPEA